MTAMMPRVRASATFTIKIVYQPDERERINSFIRDGTPTAVISPRVTRAEIGAWVESLFLRWVRFTDRVIGDTNDFEIIVRPGQPATIDAYAVDGPQRYHGTLGDDEWDAPDLDYPER